MFLSHCDAFKVKHAKAKWSKRILPLSTHGLNEQQLERSALLCLCFNSLASSQGRPCPLPLKWLNSRKLNAAPVPANRFFLRWTVVLLAFPAPFLLDSMDPKWQRRNPEITIIINSSLGSMFKACWISSMGTLDIGMGEQHGQLHHSSPLVATRKCHQPHLHNSLDGFPFGHSLLVVLPIPRHPVKSFFQRCQRLGSHFPPKARLCIVLQGHIVLTLLSQIDLGKWGQNAACVSFWLLRSVIDLQFDPWPSMTNMMHDMDLFMMFAATMSDMVTTV